MDKIVSAEPDRVYKYKRGGRYVCLGVGTHVHSGQIQVAYKGFEGRDKGKIFFAPLIDWDANFELATITADGKSVINRSIGPEF